MRPACSQHEIVKVGTNFSALFTEGELPGWAAVCGAGGEGGRRELQPGVHGGRPARRESR